MKSGSGSGRWENKYFSSSEPLDLSSKDLYRLKNINWTILLFPISFFHSFSLSFFLSFFLLFLSFLSSVSSVERAFDGHRFTLGLCSWGRRYIGPLLMYTSEPRWKTKGAFHNHPGHRRWFFSFLVNLHFAESRWTFSLLVVAQYVSWWHTSLLRKTS